MTREEVELFAQMADTYAAMARKGQRLLNKIERLERLLKFVNDKLTPPAPPPEGEEAPFVPKRKVPFSKVRVKPLAVKLQFEGPTHDVLELDDLTVAKAILEAKLKRHHEQLAQINPTTVDTVTVGDDDEEEDDLPVEEE